MRRFLTSLAVQRVGLIFCLLGLIALGLWMTALHVLAEYHLRQAQQALARQRYRIALTELHQALRFRPHSGALHLLAGRTARQSGNFSLAWEHLHRCRELEKGISAELQLEEFLLRAQTGDVDQVYPYLAAYLVQESPQTPLVLEALSHTYLFTFQFPRASECLERWLQLQPDNVQALFLRGTYYSMNTQTESAIKDFRRVLELDSEHIPARLLLAQSLREGHHYEKAAEEYKIVLRQEPTNFTARLGLATYLVDTRQWAEVRPLVDELYREKPDDAEVLHLKGRLAESDGRLEEAIYLFKAALAANPSSNSVCYHLVQCYQRQGDEESAGKYLDQLDRIEKDQARMLEITGKQAVALATDPALCCELGEVCLRLGIKQRGLHWLHAALRIDPHYRRAHEQLLHYYEARGVTEEKEAHFHRQQLGLLKKNEPR
jgi:tetratricopeptide (TPR) repeat protein